MQDKPFSNACENNKQPILNELKRVFSDTSKVFEIGSGTGQHSIFFARELSHLTWQASDRPQYLGGIRQWHSEFPATNLPAVIEFDVQQADWPEGFDAFYSANTAHIMPWELVVLTLKKVGHALPTKGFFVLYGPFNYGGEYTSPSNAQFDYTLRSRGEGQGIRDFEKVNEIAHESGLNLLEDIAMPANNRLLIWQKV